MNKWGFSINKDRQTNYDELDRTLYYFVKRIEPSIAWCIGCGSCSSCCITSDETVKMNLRKAIALLSNGLYDELPEMLAACRLCGKCTLVCPKDVNTRGVILAIEKALIMRNSK